MALTVDQEMRMQRIAGALKLLALEELPERLDEIGDDSLGEIERQLNGVIQMQDNRLQERLLFSSGPVVVFRWRNVEGWPVEYVSPNVVDLTGFTAEQYLSSAQIYAMHIPKEDLPRVMNEVQTYSASGQNWFVHQPYRLVRKDGRCIWVSDYSVIRRDSQGEITHYFGYIFDITNRIEQEQKLQQTVKVIKKLVSPVLHVWDGVLAVPLSGVFDQTFAAEMTTRLLSEISRSSAMYSILDLTGLDSIDATTMGHLVQVVRAVGLLGSTCLLSGISPEVAKIVVELGLDVSNVPAFGTLRAALEYALAHSGRMPPSRREQRIRA